MKKLADVIYGASETQVLDVFLPAGAPTALFVYFHGGGFVGGDKSKEETFVPYLIDRGIAVISANYRMYPNAKYPEFIEDAAQAVAWAYKYAREELNFDKLYVGGSSAGAYLSMMLCFDRRYLSKVGLDNSVIAGYFHDAGQPTAHFSVLKYSGIDPRRVIIDETAPLYYIGAEQTYPPMRFIVSDNDIACRYEQTMLVLSALSSFGYAGYDHVVMHGAHVEYCNKLDECGKSVYGRMIYDFIEKCRG